MKRDELSKIMGGLSPRSIDVQIVRIRSKIEDDPKEPKYLKTIRTSQITIQIPIQQTGIQEVAGLSKKLVGNCLGGSVILPNRLKAGIHLGS